MNNNDKNTQESNSDWKLRLNDLVSTCQAELKKTTKIGMKMLSASQSNAKLHETYEEIGRWAKAAIESGEIKSEDKDVIELISRADTLESQLEDFENQVSDIKKE